MNVILIGYRGSGKSTIGRILAEQLWKTLVDTDSEICKRFGGLTIAQIWEQHGEPAFRRMEVEVTCAVCARTDQVIALGGGTLMQPDARRAVEQAHDAKRIYLRCEPQELARRIQQDATTAAQRPALTPHAGGLQEIIAVLAQREPVYQAVADQVFDVTHVTPQAAAEFLLKKYL